MAAGLECYDAQGRLTFSATDALGRVLGIFNVSGASNGGTYNDPALLRGRPFALFFSDGSGYAYVNCIPRLAGQTISWSYGGQYANTGNNPSGFIVYGIY